MFWVQDILGILGKLSQMLQQQDNVLLGIKDLIHQAIERLEVLREPEATGTKLLQFLVNQAKCIAPGAQTAEPQNMQPFNSIHTFLTAPIATREGKQLTVNDRLAKCKN